MMIPQGTGRKSGLSGCQGEGKQISIGGGGKRSLQRKALLAQKKRGHQSSFPFRKGRGPRREKKFWALVWMWRVSVQEERAKSVAGRMRREIGSPRRGGGSAYCSRKGGEEVGEGAARRAAGIGPVIAGLCSIWKNRIPAKEERHGSGAVGGEAW